MSLYYMRQENELIAGNISEEEKRNNEIYKDGLLTELIRER